MNKLGLSQVDWKGRGYFEFLTLHPDPSLSREWIHWLEVLQQASRGEFSNLLSLIDLARMTDDLVLTQSCYYLLGDAGGGEVANQIRLEAVTTSDFDLMLECSVALSARGWLSDVPILLDLYEKYAKEKESSIIRIEISDLVTEQPGGLPEPSDYYEFPDFKKEFQEAVMIRYVQLIEDMGAAEIPVFQAHLFGVQPLAEWMISELQKPHFCAEWRRRFEVSTGINCTSFYKSGILQPLDAMALVEEFLNSTSIEGYKDGIRYFFGNRIHD